MSCFHICLLFQDTIKIVLVPRLVFTRTQVLTALPLWKRYPCLLWSIQLVTALSQPYLVSSHDTAHPLSHFPNHSPASEKVIAFFQWQESMTCKPQCMIMRSAAFVREPARSRDLHCRSSPSARKLSVRQSGRDKCSEITDFVLRDRTNNEREQGRDLERKLQPRMDISACKRTFIVNDSS